MRSGSRRVRGNSLRKYGRGSKLVGYNNAVIERAVLNIRGQLLFFLQSLKELKRGEKNRTDDLFQNRLGLSFLALCDDFIDMRMLAQKTISKWHGIRARVWPGHLAF